MKIKKVLNNNNDFLGFCKKLDESHNSIVREQRCPGASCCNGNEVYKNVYIMYDKDKPIGCIASTDVNNGMIEVARLYVLQEYRRQKIATKLLELVERNAKENGAKIINLDTYKRLIGAINLYKKFGFKIVPQFPELKDSYYSVCMSKEIK